MAPWRSSCYRLGVRQAVHRFRIRLEIAPGYICFLTHFTDNYEHCTGARPRLKGCPCEGSRGDPETQASGQGRRQRSTAEREVRRFAEAYQRGGDG